MAKVRVEKTILVCGRCLFGKEKEAVVTRRFKIDGERHKIDLCEEHDAMFSRDMDVWARLAEEDAGPAESHAVFTSAAAENARKAAELRAAQQAARRHNASQAHAAKRLAEIEAQQAAAAQQDDELAQARARQAEQAYEDRVRRSIPGAMKWRLTRHAQERMVERNFTLEDVLLTATQPGQAYLQPWRGPNVAVHERRIRRDNGLEDLCRVVVNKASHEVVTVVNRGAKLETAEDYAARQAIFRSPERIAQ